MTTAKTNNELAILISNFDNRKAVLYKNKAALQRLIDEVGPRTSSEVIAPLERAINVARTKEHFVRLVRVARAKLIEIARRKKEEQGSHCAGCRHNEMIYSTLHQCKTLKSICFRCIDDDNAGAFRETREEYEAKNKARQQSVAKGAQAAAAAMKKDSDECLYRRIEKKKAAEKKAPCHGVDFCEDQNCGTCPGSPEHKEEPSINLANLKTKCNTLVKVSGSPYKNTGIMAGFNAIKSGHNSVAGDVLRLTTPDQAAWEALLAKEDTLYRHLQNLQDELAGLRDVKALFQLMRAEKADNKVDRFRQVVVKKKLGELKFKPIDACQGAPKNATDCFVLCDARATSYGEPCKAPYRIVMHRYEGKWSICPQQAFKKDDGEGYEFNEYSGLPAWTLEGCIKRYMQGERQDSLYIDFGQQWLVYGMVEATRNAITLLKGLPESKYEEMGADTKAFIRKYEEEV